MDRVKKLKVKKSDGSFTDYIPIGADAEYIDMADGDNAENAISRIKSGYAHYYNNVDAMKNDTKLKENNVVETLGYYELGDGGRAKYKIRKITSNDIVDNMTIIALNNKNLIAEFIKSDSINPQQFGAVGDGVIDDSDVLLKTFKYAIENGIQVNLMQKYFINKNIVIDFNLSLIINGSKSQIGTLINENNKYFSNLIFGENGSIEINGTSNVTFNNIGFNGTKNCIIIKSFRNRILNCGFNGFENAIMLEQGLNWTGENQILNCCFNTVKNCIILNNGSDGDINGNLVDSTCDYFITGENDAGYKIENNHDYSKKGSIISGYNVTFVGNYIDGWNKLKITGNSGFNISSNTFIGNSPTEGNNYAIKFTSETIANGNITGNLLANNNNHLKNEFLYFIDLEDVSYFSGVTISGNNITICNKIFYKPSGIKIGDTNIQDIIKIGCNLVNSKAELKKSYSNLFGGSVIAYNEFQLHSPNTTEIARLDNVCNDWIHFIKMGNGSEVYTRMDNGRSIYAQGNFTAETTMKVWSIGIRDNAKLTNLY